MSKAQSSCIVSSRVDSRNPNDIQRIASDQSKSVWVEASAGSGKTKVLVDRVLRLLLAGVPPHKILCLTFTRAAAAQMQIKVNERLLLWATCPEKDLRNCLDELQDTAPEDKQLKLARCLFAHVLNCPGGMKIRTIHSFGQEVLRRFPLEAGLPPQFSVIEEAESTAIINDIMEELFLYASTNVESAEGSALAMLSEEMEDKSLAEILASMVSDPESLESSLKKYGSIDKISEVQRNLLQLNQTDSRDSIIAEAVDDRGFPTDSIRRLAKWMQDGTDEEKRKGEAIVKWLSAPAAVRKEQFDGYCQIFLTKKGQPRTRFINNKTKKEHPDAIEIATNEVDRLLLIAGRLEGISIVEQTKAILVLAVGLSNKYAAEKENKAVLDYNDLILCMDRLLGRSGMAEWVMFKLDSGIDHVLIDEAQDTSPIQWRVISKLTGDFFSGESARSDVGRTLFVVGDEKQSIFSFLKADREEFKKTHLAFKKRINSMNGDAYREVPLNVSFRSAPAILRAVDAVFSDAGTLKGVSDALVEHEAYWKNYIGRVEVWPVIEAKKDEEAVFEKEEWFVSDKNERDNNPAADLAAKLADQIRLWLDSKMQVNGKEVRAGDIMILVRHRRGLVDPIVRELKRRNIPVSGVDRMKLPEQLPVMDIMALLQFVLLPEYDLNLAVVLRGPLFGFSEEDMMNIAVKRSGTLWQSLNKKSAENKKFLDAAIYLKNMLALADVITPFSMLSEILIKPCPADGISGRRAFWSRLGPDALDPIDELLNAAHDFEKYNISSLESFLHWLKASDVEIKREIDQGGGCVRIATVHAAKGLEASVVIMPDTTTLPDKKSISKIIWHPEYEIPFYLPRESGNALAQELRGGAWQKQLEEYRRLLYVAMTRAKHHLYICGWRGARPDNSKQTWYDLIEGHLRKLHEPRFVKMDEIIAFEDDFVGAGGGMPPVGEVEVFNDVSSGLPDWAYKKALVEDVGVTHMVPSRMLGEEGQVIDPNDQSFLRGKIIHILLQNLPEISLDNRRAIASKFLAGFSKVISVDRQNEICAEVLALLAKPEFAPLFSSESRSEVPIVWSDGKISIDGQIDRLCVMPDAVWIVDYKTNRPPPDTVEDMPKAYIGQMSAYRHALMEIYKDKPVRCFILWTYGPKLMVIPDEMLTFP